MFLSQKDLQEYCHAHNQSQRDAPRRGATQTTQHTLLVHDVLAKTPQGENEIINFCYPKNESIKTLFLLIKINLEYREIVPYDHFYIPELIDKIDVKKDYVEWIRRKSLRVSVVFLIFVFYLSQLEMAKTIPTVKQLEEKREE